MDDSLKESMFQYYDDRASEYDEIYLYGKGSTALNNSTAYIEETEKLKKIVSDICFGDLIDIPCGTAFWLPSYAEKCNSLLLVDQSLRMLEISRKRAHRNGIDDRCKIVQADILNSKWKFNKFDIVLIGFFLSHLTKQEENIFLSGIKNSLKKRGKLLILDSAWSHKRAETHQKEGRRIRRLNNGTEFEIYKKYFEPNDIKEIGKKHNLKMEIHHFGLTFCAFSGKL